MVKIFIGSSTEHKSIADLICTWVEEIDGAEALHWQTAFNPGDELYRKLMELAHSVDGAIFVFAPDDKTWYRKSEIQTPRDNVVFEYGLFTGRHGFVDPKRVIICRVEDAKVASDLQGVTYVQIDPKKPHTTKQKITNWVRSVCDQPAEPTAASISRHSKTKKELFEEGTRLISEAKRSVFLCAKTPIPLMGARPYDPKSEKYEYEQSQFDKYWELAERAARSEVRLVIAASLPCIRAELSGRNEKFKAQLKNNLTRMYSLASQSDYLQLFWYSGQSPATFLVADGDTLIWFKGENGDNVWIRDNSHDLASALRSYGQEVFISRDLKHIQRALRV